MPRLALLLPLLAVAATAEDVLLSQLGAVPGVDSLAVAKANAFILRAGLVSTAGDGDVLVVDGDFYIQNVSVTYTNNVQMRVEGSLIANNNISAWPIGRADSDSKAAPVLYFYRCQGVSIFGPGTIDGQGYDWWWNALLSFLPKFEDNRPMLLMAFGSTDITLGGGLLLRNSPFWTCNLERGARVHIEDVEIFVDVFKQQEMMQELGLIDEETGIPTYPLNTDGFDLSVDGAVLRNITILNWDDAVVPKPCKSSYETCQCSSNILVDGAKVKYSVGMTIGTVSPTDPPNCVENVTFANVEMERPLKAVYIKTNYHTDGSATIKNITYVNMTVHDPIWWPVYVGPQQQTQPDGSGSGCDLWDRDCPTEPKVTISDVTLMNVTMDGALWWTPGQMRCNETNPCENFVLNDVSIARRKDSGILKYEWDCDNIHGVFTNVDPELSC